MLHRHRTPPASTPALDRDRVLPAVTLFVLAALCLAVPPGAAQSDGACQSDARRRALDFLLGTWDAVGASGEVEGRVVVESLLNGCLLVETSRAPGGADSVGYWLFDPLAEQWRVTRADAEGRVYRLQGRARQNELSVAGEAVDAGGQTTLLRGTRRLEAGRIRQTWEASTDDGESWAELWRGDYVPAGTQLTQAATPPAPRQERATVRPAAPAPAPDPPRSETPRNDRRTPEPRPPDATAVPATTSPAPTPASPQAPSTGQVAARSLEPPSPPPPVAGEPPAGAVAELTPRDAGARRDPIRMASPMQLQFPIGPIEKLQDGYGWTNNDTGAYQVEEVRLESVEVSRRPRRGAIELRVALRLAGVGLMTNAGAAVELLDGAGNAIESSDLGRFPLGKGLTEQSQYGFITKVVTFAMDRARFEQLFAADAPRPELRITLATGDSR